MASADDEQNVPLKQTEPAADEHDPAFAAAVLRARLWVLLIGGIALAGIVIMCLIVGLLILRES